MGRCNCSALRFEGKYWQSQRWCKLRNEKEMVSVCDVIALATGCLLVAAVSIRVVSRKAGLGAGGVVGEPVSARQAQVGQVVARRAQRIEKILQPLQALVAGLTNDGVPAVVPLLPRSRARCTCVERKESDHASRGRKKKLRWN